MLRKDLFLHAVVVVDITLGSDAETHVGQPAVLSLVQQLLHFIRSPDLILLEGYKKGILQTYFIPPQKGTNTVSLSSVILSITSWSPLLHREVKESGCAITRIESSR